MQKAVRAPQLLIHRPPRLRTAAEPLQGRAPRLLLKVCFRLQILLFWYYAMSRSFMGDMDLYPCCLLAIALMLTKVIVEGNTQLNTKKQPIPLIRNASPRDSNGEKPTSPQLRPSTAIDPLSHVCLPLLSRIFYLWGASLRNAPHTVFTC
jgi:hypothetical protein